MFKLTIAVVLTIVLVAAGLFAAFVAWDSMYPDKGHVAAKGGVVLISAVVFLGFMVILANSLFALYE